MQCTVDFENVGGSASELSHLVNRHNKAQLNFELNLRGYRNKSPFKADAPWLYPAPKAFSPEHTLKNFVDQAAGSHYTPQKNTFVDKFNESNVNQILPTLEKSTTVYRNAEW